MSQLKNRKQTVRGNMRKSSKLLAAWNAVAVVESIESRLMLSTTTPALTPDYANDIECVSGPYGGACQVQATVHSASGSSQYYTAFSMLEFGNLAGAITGGASALNNFQLAMDLRSGYQDYAGNISIYFVPNDSIAFSSLRAAGDENQGDTSEEYTGINMLSDSSNTGTDSNGTVDNPAPADYGITGNGSAYLLGTFTIPDGGSNDGIGEIGNLAAGYTTFESAATGSLSDGNATIIDSNINMGSAAQAGIINDINTNQAVRFVIVAADTSVGVSWTPYSAAGNVTTNPQLQLNYNAAPVVSDSASSYSITERDQNPGNTTPVTITVNDPYAATASSTTYINYSTATGTASSPGDYTAATGTLAFAPGNTTQTFTVNAVDENTTTTSKTFYVNLTDAGNNTPAAIINNGNAAVTVNYIQNLVVSAGNASFNETVVGGNVTGGNVTINFTRSSTGTINGNSSFTWTTADGTPYTTQGNQTEGNAEAGRDYGYGVGNTTAVSGTYTFTGNQTTGSITIPILAANTFAGNRSFTVNLSSPSAGTNLGSVGNITQSASVTITDTLNGNAATTSGNVTGDGSIEYDGLYNGNSYAELLSNTSGKLTYVSWSYFEINNTSSLFPTTYAVTGIDSVRLSLFNAGGTSGNYGGNPGSVDLYLIQDNLSAFPTSAGPLFYGTPAGQKPTSASQVAGNTGPSELGIGGNTTIGGNATFIGTAYFPNNYAGYNDFTFDNLPSGVSTKIAATLDSGTTLRFAMISHTSSAARVEWDGSLSDGNTPKVSIDAQTSNSAVEDFSLTSGTSSVNKTAGSVTTDSITVNRTGHPDMSDGATLAYTITPLTGVLGTDYGNVAGCNTISGSSIVGNVTFGNTSGGATIPVNILGNPAYGTETFLVTLGNATTGNNTRYAFLTGNITQTITINDPRTETVSGKISFPSGPSSGNGNTTTMSTIGISGNTSVNGFVSSTALETEPYTPGTTTTYLYYNVLTFNLAADTTNFLVPTDPVAQINQVNLNLTSETFSYSGNGTFNVWIVPNTTAAIGNTTTLKFDTTNDVTQGLGQQLGTPELLGSFAFNKTTPVGAQSYLLSNCTPNGLAALEAALNNAQGGGAGTFRLAITSATGAAGAEWYGSGTNAPSLSVNFTPGSGATSAPSIPTTPVVGSVTAPSMSMGTPVTLTASNVTDSGGNVTSVAFYLQANTNNGNAALGDIFLGNGTLASGNATSGTWTLGNVSTTQNLNGKPLSLGSYTFYAVATDNIDDVSVVTASAPVSLGLPKWMSVPSGGNVTWSGGNNTLTINSGNFTIDADPANTTGAPTIIDNSPSSFITIDTKVSDGGDGDALVHIAKISGNGTTTITGTNVLVTGNFTQTALVNNGAIQINGNAAVAQLTGSGNLTVGNGSSNNTVQITAGSTPDSFNNTQQAVIVSVGSTLDITNNTLLLDYGAGSTPLAAVQAAVSFGAGVGASNASGAIISSTALAGQTGQYTVGYADSTELGSIPSGNVKMMFTLSGDAYLVASVNFNDYSVLQDNYNQSGRDWSQADYSHDGSSTFYDYSLLQNNYNQSIPAAVFSAAKISVAAASSVEPAAAAVYTPVIENLFASDASILA